MASTCLGIHAVERVSGHNSTCEVTQVEHARPYECNDCPCNRADTAMYVY
jgi:hypothetical protein